MDDLDIAVIRKEFQYNYDYYVQKKKKKQRKGEKIDEKIEILDKEFLSIKKNQIKILELNK